MAEKRTCMMCGLELYNIKASQKPICEFCRIDLGREIRKVKDRYKRISVKKEYEDD